MKKSKNTRNYSSKKSGSSSSVQIILRRFFRIKDTFRILRRFFRIKDTFSFDIFSFLKAENEKLQIVFANIRV